MAKYRVNYYVMVRTDGEITVDAESERDAVSKVIKRWYASDIPGDDEMIDAAAGNIDGYPRLGNVLAEEVSDE